MSTVQAGFDQAQKAIAARDAEVERLREQRVKQNRSHCELTEQMHDAFAAERQQIAGLFRAHCPHTGRCENEKSYCEWCATADRIAAGEFAPKQEEGRDGE